MRPGKLFLFAILIRLLFLILALLADSLSPDYDNSMLAEVSRQSTTKTTNSSLPNSRKTVYRILDPLMRWDAVHFRHIAKFGYTHEHLCAFFQQTPNLFKAFGLVSSQQQQQLINNNNNNEKNRKNFFETSPPPSILNEILFLCFHVLCFAFATIFLRSLLLHLTDRMQSSLSQTGLLRPSLLVWLINPASIFFTAAYTETYFALVAFAGMFCVQKMHFYSGYTAYGFDESLLIDDNDSHESDDSNNTRMKNKNNKTQKELSLVTTNLIDNDGESREVPVTLLEKDYLDDEYDRRSPSPIFGKNTSQQQREYDDNTNHAGENNNKTDNDTTSMTSTSMNKRTRKDHQRISVLMNEDDQQQQQDSSNENNIKNKSNDKRKSSSSSTLSPSDELHLRQKGRALAELRSRTPSKSKISFARTFTWSVAAALCFYVATTFRSNGILLAGFLIHFGVCRLWFDSSLGSTVRKLLFLPADVNNNNNNNNNNNTNRRLHPLHKLIMTVVCFGLSYLVTIPYQNHIKMCYTTFCGGENSHFSSNYAPDDFSENNVCIAGEKGFYSRIQYKYWKVGLFSYFTPNNIPNFIIALPTFLFVGIGLWFRFRFSKKNHQDNNKNNKHNSDKDSDNDDNGADFSVSSSSSLFFRPRQNLLTAFKWLSTLEACHIVYLAAQLIFAFLTMNVQVVTRFVAASPAIYYLYGELLWKCSLLTEGTGRLIAPYIFDDNDEKFLAKWKKIAKVLKPLCFGFVIVWAVVGTAMFPNFMPWT